MILGGTILTAAFLVLLAWTEQLVSLASGCETADCDGHKSLQAPTVALAIIWTIFLSVSVQPVQAGVRSLMVDIAPANQQSRASSWAGRIQGMSAIFSFFASSLNLADLPGLQRLSQFQALACLNLITLGSTVLITCIFIPEKDSRHVELDDQRQEGILSVLRHIFRTLKELRGKIRQTCETQFCSWFAWFPFLYYNTTYIGELGENTLLRLIVLLTNRCSRSRHVKRWRQPRPSWIAGESQLCHCRIHHDHSAACATSAHIQVAEEEERRTCL